MLHCCSEGGLVKIILTQDIFDILEVRSVSLKISQRKHLNVANIDALESKILQSIIVTPCSGWCLLQAAVMTQLAHVDTMRPWLR